MKNLYKLPRTFFIAVIACLALISGSFDVKGQTTYTLTGTGTANAWNRNQFPIMFGNTCSRTTQLFTKAKLNGGGIPSSGTVDFAKIAWHPILSRNIEGTLTIYMRHRASAAGAITNASWDITGAVTVFSGPVSHVLAQGVWWEVPFTTNFTWNNTDDIQILVEYTRTNTANQLSGYVWRGYDGNEPANTTAFQVGTTCPTTLNATFSPNRKFYDTRLTTAGSSPLTLGTITATQQTGTVTKGSTKQGILKIDIPTSGSTGTQTLNSVTVTTANTNNADIAANGVKLWVGSTLATATQLGSGQNAAATVTFSGLSQTISGATTSLWVTYDIASGATLGNFVDAQITSGGITITASGGATAPGTQPVSTLNPAGNRKIDYCNDLYSIGCGNLGIGNVSIGTAGAILNQTGTGCTGGLTFADFTALSGISMSAGSTYPVNITDVEDFFPIYSAGIGIWIDLNQNGSFGDAGELIGSIANQQGPWAFNITVPAGASSGTYRMRIKATENVSQSLGSSCSKDNGGETHDYLVTISGGASCTSPNGSVSFGAFSGVSSSATTTNVTYTNGGNAATGYVLLRNTSNTAPTAPASGTAVPSAGSTSFVSGYTVVNTTTTLGSSVAFASSGLSASTTYYYWVMAYQSTNGPCWFTPATQTSNSQATTSASCTAPNGTVGFSFTGVTPDQTTINATYTNGGNAATGYVLLRNTSNTAPTAPASGTEVPSAGNSVTWGSSYTVVGTTTSTNSSVGFISSGLTCNTQYYYWVVAYQNTGGPCWFTPSHSGNTQTTQGAPSLPPTPTGNVNPSCGTSSTYSITAVPGATSYDWKLEQSLANVGPLNTAGTSVSMTFTSSGYLTVQANNACGSSGYLTLASRLGISVTRATITLSNSPVASTANVCYSASSQTASFAYSATTLSPNQYSISGWSGGSFANVTNATLPASPISVTVPAATPVGTYTALLTVRNSTTSCSSSSYTITIVVNENVSITSATAGTNPVCSGNTTSITANGVAGTNASLTWWTGAGGTGTNLGSSNPLTNQGTGTYYARVTGDCGSPVEASVTITSTSNLSAVSLSPSTAQNFNTGGTGNQLTASETGGSTITSRQWGWRSTSGGAITSISGQTGTTYTPAATDLNSNTPGTYYVVCTSTPTCGSSMVSNEVTVVVTSSSGPYYWVGGTSAVDVNIPNAWSTSLGGTPIPSHTP